MNFGDDRQSRRVNLEVWLLFRMERLARMWVWTRFAAYTAVALTMGWWLRDCPAAEHGSLVAMCCLTAAPWLLWRAIRFLLT